MQRKYGFEGRKILITGGARGIGRELSEQLIDRGAHVLAVGRNEADLARLAADHPGAVDYLVADLNEAAMPRAVSRWVAAEHADLQVLINNAAVMFNPNLLSPETGFEDDLHTEITVNLTAPIALATHLLPILAGNGDAMVVNVTSGLALSPKVSAPIYCATKAGLRSFTKALRYQCEDAGADIHIAEAVMTLVDTALSGGDPAKKLAPDAAALEVIEGMEARAREIWVERTRKLRLLHRVSPALADRVLRSA